MVLTPARRFAPDTSRSHSTSRFPAAVSPRASRSSPSARTLLSRCPRSRRCPWIGRSRSNRPTLSPTILRTYHSRDCQHELSRFPRCCSRFSNRCSPHQPRWTRCCSPSTRQSSIDRKCFSRSRRPSSFRNYSWTWGSFSRDLPVSQTHSHRKQLSFEHPCSIDFAWDHSPVRVIPRSFWSNSTGRSSTPVERCWIPRSSDRWVCSSSRSDR